MQESSRRFSGPVVGTPPPGLHFSHHTRKLQTVWILRSGVENHWFNTNQKQMERSLMIKRPWPGALPPLDHLLQLWVLQVCSTLNERWEMGWDISLLYQRTRVTHTTLEALPNVFYLSMWMIRVTAKWNGEINVIKSNTFLAIEQMSFNTHSAVNSKAIRGADVTEYEYVIRI